MLKQQKGVTLVALVITIIVLLILAGVSIAMLTGENGVLTKAKESSSETTIAEEREAAQIDINAAMSAWYEAKYAPSATTASNNFQEYLNTVAADYLKQGTTSSTSTDGKKYIYTVADNKVTKITTIHSNKDKKTESATVKEDGGLDNFQPDTPTP